MVTIIGYRLTVHSGARKGLVKTYGPGKLRVASRFQDKLDAEYGGYCASVVPVYSL
jgi:hypothetical protein